MNVQRFIADDEFISSDMRIQPGSANSGIGEYTYYGGGLLSDPDGNIYHYDKDGFIYDKDGNPNSDKVIFQPSTADYCAGIFPKTGEYAQTFEKQPLESDNSDLASEADIPVQANSASGSAPETFKVEAACRGNVTWKDFFPSAPDYNANAKVTSMPISLTFDFKNGTVESDFCGSGENPNDGWTQGSADFCVTVKESDLYREFDGTWAFDAVWDIDLDMSAAQLHWVDNTEVWAYSGQSSRFEAPFHGWLEPGDGSLYSDEVLPATFQFLCDFISADDLFD